MRILLVALIVLVSAAGAFAHGSQDDYIGSEEIIKGFCASKWQDDTAKREACVESQMDALEKIKALKDVPKEVFEKCEDKWPNDFFMRFRCIKGINSTTFGGL